MPIDAVTSQEVLVTYLTVLEVPVESLEAVLETVIEELEEELNDNRDPLMALAGCVGTVLLHWDSLDGVGRRALLSRVEGTVKALEMQARRSVGRARPKRVTL